MDKILNILFEYFPKLTIKQMLTFVIIVVVYFLCSLFLSSCSLINRSSASGFRKVEKTVIQEQKWNVPANTQTTRVITSYKKQS